MKHDLPWVRQQLCKDNAYPIDTRQHGIDKHVSAKAIENNSLENAVAEVARSLLRPE